LNTQRLGQLKDGPINLSSTFNFQGREQNITHRIASASNQDILKLTNNKKRKKSKHKDKPQSDASFETQPQNRQVIREDINEYDRQTPDLPNMARP